ncbi:MAG: ribosome biogenesis GTP-binding protein YihA/YsxC [Lutibacter sp.]|jgi:GTP-binding protein|nr:ribosome biogenesis GTP-binding protein YihA/YsxC [Lutibacter sp.]
MNIKRADFVISNTNVLKCPKEPLPEYAFIGRSNVGKSSLINMLTDRKQLAKTSGKPGKTQLINHFRINEQWFLVDLPGYGYAKVSKSKRASFQQFIREYFMKRRQLVCTFVLLDIRIPPQQIDLEFMSFLGENNLPFCMVFTKSDKLNTAQLNRNLDEYNQKMTDTSWESMPPFFVSSATKKAGRQELLAYIDQLNHDLMNPA